MEISISVVADITATHGDLIIPLDHLYDKSGALIENDNPYFTNFRYQLGDNSATINTNVLNGPIEGIEGSNKYISIPVDSPENAATELNLRVFCSFTSAYRAHVCKGTLFFKDYVIMESGNIVAEYPAECKATNYGLLREVTKQYSAYKEGTYIYRALPEENANMKITPAMYCSSNFTTYDTIPPADTDPLTVEIYVSPGVIVTPTSNADKYTITGSMNQGFNITRTYQKGETTAADQPSKVEQQKDLAPQEQALPDDITGDLDKDVQMLVMASVGISRRMMVGNVPQEEQDKVQHLIDAANKYYTSKGQGEQFGEAMKTEMAKELERLLIEQGQQPHQSTH